MPDFFTIDVPTLSPTECAFCASASDPEGFIDSGLDFLSHGHVWICATCVKQAGDRFGMLSAEDAAWLRTDLAATKRELDVALAQLADERERVLTTVKDLRSLVAPKAKAS